jgi:Tfp pilus assembly protein PilO
VFRGITERYGRLKVDAAGIGCCVAASLVFYWLIVQPFLQRQSTTARQCRELEVQQEQAAELKAVLGRTRAQLAGAQARLAASTTRLEPVTHINRRIARLTQFFAACDLEVDDIQTGKVSHGPPYDVIPITVIGRGSYGQCTRLFHRLHSVCPDMSVARIELSANPAQAATQATFQLEFIWYAVSGGSLVALDTAGNTQHAVPER